MLSSSEIIIEFHVVVVKQVGEHGDSLSMNARRCYVDAVGDCCRSCEYIRL